MSTKKKREKREKKTSPCTLSKKRDKREKKKPLPMKDFVGISAHACAREGEVDQVRFTVKEALSFCHAEDALPKTVEDNRKLAKEIERDERTWLKLANRNLNTFLGVLMEFMTDIEEKGWKYRHRPSSFQKRLNSAFPKKGQA